MKKLVFSVAFMLIGTFAFANTEFTNEVNKIENVANQNNPDSSKDQLLGCSSKTVTVTTTNPNGSSSSTTTTTVNCDTPRELAQYHAAMNEAGIKR